MAQAVDTPYSVRRLEFGEYLDDALLITRDYIKPILIVVAVVLFSVNVAYLAVLFSTNTDWMIAFEPEAPPSEAEMEAFFANMLAGLAIMYVYLVIFFGVFVPIAMGAISYIAGMAYLRYPVTWQAGLRQALRKAFPLIGMQIISGLAIIMGYAMCLIPGLILTVIWYVTVPAIMFEDAGPVQSLGRSTFLTQGERLKIFALIFVLGALGMGVGAFSALVPSQLLQTALSTFLSSFLQGFVAVLSTVIYFSSRCRHEHLDLDLLANEVDLPPEEAAL